MPTIAGEIAHLAALAAPDVGLVINAGPAHLEGFGGLDGVARAKGEMFEALGPDGTAVINADDRYAPLWHGLAQRAARRITFGMRESADFRASQPETRLATGWLRHGVHARIAAWRTPHHAQPGRRAQRVERAGRGRSQPCRRGRSRRHRAWPRRDAAGVRSTAARPAIAGARLIDDSYNANPGSVRAGLRSLAAIPGEHWLVLGEMAELGPDSARLHAEIGEFARETGVARLLAVGPETRYAVESFGPGASWFANAEELVGAIGPGLRQGVTVLIKGSRVNRLERVAAALAASGSAPPGGVH